MDVTQVMESGLEAIQVVGCIVKSCQNPLAMGLYFGICGWVGQVSEGAEIPLGPRVDEELQILQKHYIYIYIYIYITYFFSRH
uniref:Uncharacterized protein n=1 Tax=Leptobrachium leishanense TaxID=445787 RepID=A0A8C5W9P8_9ANUR